jgi:hypothetical protein
VTAPAPDFSRRTTTKLGRPKGARNATSEAIRAAISDLQSEYRVMTVRQAFYRLTTRAVVEKTEAGYRQVQRQILLMRREGVLPWRFIADTTRWQRKPETFDEVEDAVAQLARTYRRNLWRTQNIRLEVWLEKDALASVVAQATVPWDVPLMVSRGQSSDTFIWQAAQAAREAWRAKIETTVFALYDSDRSGRDAAEKIREKLATYSGNVPIAFELLAVTDEQIEEWGLPTRPAKEDASETAVELDAIDPTRLVALVNDAIVGRVDQETWAHEKLIEESEREGLLRMSTGEAL